MTGTHLWSGSTFSCILAVVVSYLRKVSDSLPWSWTYLLPPRLCVRQVI